MTDVATPRAKERWRFGPGLLVTAAFIGPGTVATASRAGAQFGFALLWTLLFAVVATIVLQEMAARLGLVSRRGLAEAIRESITPVWARRSALGLVLTAIVLGNSAYQTGNLIGAGMGISVLTGLPANQGAAIVGGVIVVLLASGGSNQRLQTMLIVIVLAMSAAFLATMFVVRPELRQVARGITTVSLPAGSLLTALALLGTTVVPYNLFLHATAVQQRWSKDADLRGALRASRFDTVAAIAIGGLVTMAIVATAAAAFHANGIVPGNAGELANQLEPLFGPAGKYLFAAGLAAAGITSAITAPLAAGYAAAGTFSYAPQRIIKWTAIGVVIVGTCLANRYGNSPQSTIVVAQAANGLLLPLVALFLLLVMNRRDLLGDHRNSWLLNLAGGAVVVVTCVLGIKSLATINW